MGKGVILQHHDREMKRAIAYLKREMKRWGSDIDHLSDEEIIAGVKRVSDVMPATGISCDEAARNLRDVMSAMTMGDQL